MPEDKIIALVNEHTEKPLLGIFGPSKVNVLKLNISLDNLR
jgi:K+-transporting ATPase ATPase C chain